MPKGRRIRAYSAMNEEKLKRVYLELIDQGEAYYRCLERGSGDPERDIREVEWVADIRCVELPMSVSKGFTIQAGQNLLLTRHEEIP